MSDTICTSCQTDVPHPHGFDPRPDGTGWYANYYCPKCHRQWRFKLAPDQWSPILRARWLIDHLTTGDLEPWKDGR